MMDSASELDYVYNRGNELAMSLRHLFALDHRDAHHGVHYSSDLFNVSKRLHDHLPPDLVPIVQYIGQVWLSIDRYRKNTKNGGVLPPSKAQLLICTYHFHMEPLSRYLHVVPPPPSLSGLLPQSPGLYPPHVMTYGGYPPAGPAAAATAPNSSHFPHYSFQPQAAAAANMPPLHHPLPQPSSCSNDVKDSINTNNSESAVTVTEQNPQEQSVSPNGDMISSDSTTAMTAGKDNEIQVDGGKVKEDHVEEPRPPPAPAVDIILKKKGRSSSSSKKNSSAAATAFNFFSGQTLETTNTTNSTSPATPKQSRISHQHGSIGKLSPLHSVSENDLEKSGGMKDPQATNALKALLNIESSKEQLQPQEETRPSDAVPVSVERRLDVDRDTFHVFTSEILQRIEKATSTKIATPPKDAFYFSIRGDEASKVAEAVRKLLQHEKIGRQTMTMMDEQQSERTMNEDNQKTHEMVAVAVTENLSVSVKKQSQTKQQRKSSKQKNKESSANKINAISARRRESYRQKYGFDDRSLNALLALPEEEIDQVMETFNNKRSELKNCSAWLQRACHTRRSSKNKLQSRKTSSKNSSTSAPSATNPAIPELDHLSDSEEEENENAYPHSNKLMVDNQRDHETTMPTTSSASPIPLTKTDPVWQAEDHKKAIIGSIGHQKTRYRQRPWGTTTNPTSTANNGSGPHGPEWSLFQKR